MEIDNIKLLRECDAGVEMGMSSIDEVLPYVKAKELKQLLTVCKEEHEKLEREIRTLLRNNSDEGKDPNPMAKGMSWIKTNVKLVFDESDSTIADLMTEGCNMGVKSLNEYLNQYEEADESIKNICHRLISMEEQLRDDISEYL